MNIFYKMSEDYKAERTEARTFEEAVNNFFGNQVKLAWISKKEDKEIKEIMVWADGGIFKVSKYKAKLCV